VQGGEQADRLVDHQPVLEHRSRAAVAHGAASEDYPGPFAIEGPVEITRVSEGFVGDPQRDEVFRVASFD
jgi:hypothetical protein